MSVSLNMCIGTFEINFNFSSVLGGAAVWEGLDIVFGSIFFFVFVGVVFGLGCFCWFCLVLMWGRFCWYSYCLSYVLVRLSCFRRLCFPAWVDSF